MKNNIFIFLFICLLVSLLGNYIQMRSAVEQSFYRNQENDRFQVEQSRKLGEIRARDSVILSLEQKGIKDSIRHWSKQKSLISQANALKAKIKKGPLIIQDTVILYLDSLVADLTHERDTIRIENSIKTDSLKASVNQLTEMFREQWIRADKFQRDYDREKRKRFSVGPHAGWDLNGPSIGVSVQYTILRF